MGLKELKKKYADLSKKYKLPNFVNLNEDFEVEKIERDTDLLLKAIRKVMMEKIVNSMSFLEMLLNPVNSPRMYHPFIRTMGNEDKSKIDSLYISFADLSLISLDLEIRSDEAKEAELISHVFKKWNELKPLFCELLSNVKKPRDFVKKERTYFG